MEKKDGSKKNWLEFCLGFIAFVLCAISDAFNAEVNEKRYKKAKKFLFTIDRFGWCIYLFFFASIIWGAITNLDELFGFGFDYSNEMIFSFIKELNNYSWSILINVCLGIIVVLFALVCIWFIIKVCLDIIMHPAKSIIYEYELKTAKEELEEDLFENSLKMSYKYLNQYYSQTREQARKGFILTSCVTVVGATLIFVGIIILFFNKTEPAYISVAGGVIIEFISSIMFYFHNKSIQCMGNYHDKLFYSQNIAIALKVTETVSDAKQDEVKAELVKNLITGMSGNMINEAYCNNSLTEMNKDMKEKVVQGKNKD